MQKEFGPIKNELKFNLLFPVSLKVDLLLQRFYFYRHTEERDNDVTEGFLVCLLPPPPPSIFFSWNGYAVAVGVSRVYIVKVFFMTSGPFAAKWPMFFAK